MSSNQNNAFIITKTVYESVGDFARGHGIKRKECLIPEHKIGFAIHNNKIVSYDYDDTVGIEVTPCHVSNSLIEQLLNLHSQKKELETMSKELAEDAKKYLV